jgi:hypothetical protein
MPQKHLTRLNPQKQSSASLANLQRTQDGHLEHDPERLCQSAANIGKLEQQGNGRAFIAGMLGQRFIGSIDQLEDMRQELGRSLKHLNSSENSNGEYVRIVLTISIGSRIM